MRADLMTVAGSWLLTYLLHSTLLLGLAWAVSRRLVQAPAMRDILWKAALVGGLVSASLQVGFGLTPVAGAVALDLGRKVAATSDPAPLLDATTAWNGMLPGSRAPEAPAAPRAALGHGPASRAPNPLSVAPAPAPAVPAPAESAGRLLPWALAFWLVGGLALCGLYLMQRSRAMRRIGPRLPVADPILRRMLDALRQAGGVRRTVRLTSASGLNSPVALGANEIALPEAALTELDLEQQRSMLAHELAHLARRDPTWLALACVMERAFFFQPLNRVARHGMQEAAELLCDDWAVYRTGSGFSLATCLVKVAEWVDTTPRAVPLAGMAEHRSQLVTRIHRLIEGRTMPATPRMIWLAAGAVLLFGITAVAAPGITAAGPVDRPAVTSPEPALAVAAARADAQPEADPQPEADLVQGMAATVDTPDTMVTRLSRLLNAVRARSRNANEYARAARADAVRSTLARVEMRAARAPRAFVLAGGASWSDRRQAGDTTSIAVPALIAALKDSDVEVRRAAAGSLSNLEDPRAIPALIDALKDGDAEVRGCAARALGNFEDKRAIPGLVALLKDGNKDVRAAALSSLQSMANEVPDEAILSALSDADPEVRQTAIQLATNRISEHSDEENYKPDARYQAAFVRLMQDPSRDVRQEAVSALGELRLTEAPAALLALAADKDPDIRQAVANTLGQIGDAHGVPTLKTLLADPSSDVRESAVNGLSQIRDRTALEALVGALKSSDPAVRRAAAEALGQRER